MPLLSLKKLRAEVGLSTTQLAHRLGVSQSTIVRLEQSADRGTITLNRLCAIVEALDCSLVVRIVPNTRKRSRVLRPGKRISRTRTKSMLSESLRADVAAGIKVLSAEQRLRRACELSDFIRKLPNV